MKLDDVVQAFDSLNEAIVHLKEQMDDNLSQWVEWIRHHKSNNWCKMHGYPMKHHKRYRHERRK